MLDCVTCHSGMLVFLHVFFIHRGDVSPNSLEEFLDILTKKEIKSWNLTYENTMFFFCNRQQTPQAFVTKHIMLH